MTLVAPANGAETATGCTAGKAGATTTSEADAGGCVTFPERSQALPVIWMSAPGGVDDGTSYTAVLPPVATRTPPRRTSRA